VHAYAFRHRQRVHQLREVLAALADGLLVPDTAAAQLRKPARVRRRGRRNLRHARLTKSHVPGPARLPADVEIDEAYDGGTSIH
jgi:hypothetical protein